MTTPQYFTWQDSSPKTTDAARLEAAAQRFSEKYGAAATPGKTLVHAEQRPVTMPLACAGMTVDTATWMVRGRVCIEIVEAAA